MLTQAAKNKIRLIFMGTPDFAVPGLTSLIAAPDFEIIGVYTQSDKPVGRKQLLTPPAIKTTALQNNLKVFQPIKIKTTTEIIRSLKPDLIVVIAYGQIIPPDILDIPTYGCLNIHASLLPKYRGAACLNAPILNGDEETGITIMKMEAGLDTGPILKQEKIKLNGQETLETVHDKLAVLGADLLIPTLRDFLAEKIKPKEQDESQASYVKTLKKEDGRIDWKKTAIEIERSVRAYNPWPGTYTLMTPSDGQESEYKIIKILKTEHQPLIINKYKIGEIFRENNKLMVQCGQDALTILKLQLAGGRASTAEEFICGHQDFIGHILE